MVNNDDVRGMGGLLLFSVTGRHWSWGVLLPLIDECFRRHVDPLINGCFSRFLKSLVNKCFGLHIDPSLTDSTSMLDNLVLGTPATKLAGSCGARHDSVCASPRSQRSLDSGVKGLRRARHGRGRGPGRGGTMRGCHRLKRDPKQSWLGFKLISKSEFQTRNIFEPQVFLTLVC